MSRYTVDAIDAAGQKLDFCSTRMAPAIAVARTWARLGHTAVVVTDTKTGKPVPHEVVA